MCSLHNCGLIGFDFGGTPADPALEIAKPVTLALEADRIAR